MNLKMFILLLFFGIVISASAVSAAEVQSIYTNDDIQDSVIGESIPSFDDLQVEINNAPEGSVLDLNKDYNGDYGSRIQLHKNLTIDGHGHTLDCLNTECSVFYSSSGNIILKNLNMINGHNDDNYMGGAIHIEGSAQYTFENCTFNNNWADDYGGAIYNGVNKPLTIINCNFNNNEADDVKGGAIYSVGDVNIINSVFNSNVAKQGGAIYCENNMNVSRCLFTSNRVEGSFSYKGMGGAIFCKVLYLDNSTFKDNSADEAGAVHCADTIYINANQNNTQSINTFFINNKADGFGGAISAGNALFDALISNTEFTGNMAEYGGAVYFFGLNITHCLFKSNSASSNGGAIDSSSGVLDIDNCTFIDNFADNEGGAIHCKDININVRQTPGQSYSTFFINNKNDDVDGGAIRAYGGNLNAVNALFSGNSAEHHGGAAYVYGHVSVDHCLFEFNSVNGDAEQCYGGAIYAYRDAHINNSTFIYNSAQDYGGAVYANNIYVNPNQGSGQSFSSFFINNKAGDNDGGALYSCYNAEVNNAVFNGNTAFEDGGAIFCCDNAYVTHSLFDSNRAEGATLSQCEGGAIHCKDDLTVDNCTFKNNYAQDYGGAIYADTVALKATPSYFEANTAYDNQGGAIWTNKFREDVKYATFINNNAGQGANDDGGAIYIDDENWITFSQCVFVINHCGDEGGAIYLDSKYSHLTLKNNIFLGNTAVDGQTVFNKGYYDAITDNWWGDNLPNQYNNLLVEWKATIFQSNVHHADSHPVYLKLKLIPDVCNVGESVWAQVCFYHYNDGSLCNGEMNTEYISFMPIPNISFHNRVDHEYYVNTRVLAKEPGTYSITANLFGQFSSATLTVNGKTLFGLSNSNENNLDIVSFDRDDNEIVTTLLTDVVAEYNMLTDGSDLQYEDSNTHINNESDSNSTPFKSINQPKTAESNNNIYLILVIILLIGLAGYGIKKYRG